MEDMGSQGGDCKERKEEGEGDKRKPGTPKACLGPGCINVVKKMLEINENQSEDRKKTCILYVIKSLLSQPRLSIVKASVYSKQSSCLMVRPFPPTFPISVLGGHLTISGTDNATITNTLRSDWCVK